MLVPLHKKPPKVTLEFWVERQEYVLRFTQSWVRFSNLHVQMHSHIM